MNFFTFRSYSGRRRRSISERGKDSSSAPWDGEGAFDTFGLLWSDGDNNCTGTFAKCSVGIRIFVWHFAQTVRWHNLQWTPRGPRSPNLVRKQRKHNLRRSTSSFIRMPTGRLSSSAFVITERIWTISSRVNDNRSFGSTFSFHWFSSSEFFVHVSIELKFDVELTCIGGWCCGAVDVAATEDCVSIDWRDSGRDGGTEWLCSFRLFRLWHPTIVWRRIDARLDSHCVAKS